MKEFVFSAAALMLFYRFEWEIYNDFLNLKLQKNYIPYKLLTMNYPTITLLDRLAPKHILSGARASILGMIGSLCILALCLGVYVPVVMSYFNGIYYQSQYTRETNKLDFYYTGQDFKIAVVFRHKKTGVVFNHASLLSTLTVLATSSNNQGYFEQPMIGCDNDYFVGDINGERLQDCLLIPKDMQFNSGYDGYSYGIISFQISAPSSSVPFNRASATLNYPQSIFYDLLDNYYCQFYFTSKVLTPQNEVKFQVHRIYSSQFTVGSDYITSFFKVKQEVKTTVIDDSILPWVNHRQITTLNWMGEVQYGLNMDLATSLSMGVKDDFEINNKEQYSIRYYKKLDWLIGIIGGGMFLFFVIFYTVFNWLNSQLLKIELPNKLFVQNISGDNPLSDKDLAAVSIPSYYIITRLLPYFKNQKYQQLISNAQMENDIVLQIKKLKVVQRNLKRKNLMTDFQPKVVRLNNEEEEQWNNTISLDSQLNQQLREEEANRTLDPASGKAKVIQMDMSKQQLQEDHSQIDSQQYPQLEHNQIANPPVILLSDGMNNIQATPTSNQPNTRQMQNQFPIANIYEHIEEPALIQHNSYEPLTNLASVQLLQPQQQVIVINDPNVPTDPEQLAKYIADVHRRAAAVAESFKPVEAPPVIMQQDEYQAGHNAGAPILQYTSATDIDDKFNLTSDQLQYLLKQKQILPTIMDTNATWLAMRTGKPDHYYDFMNLQQYDKWQGHFVAKKKKILSTVVDFVADSIKKVDFFNVKVDFNAQPHTSTFCGVLITVVIIVLSILTFFLTIKNMSMTQIQINESYQQLSDMQFHRTTDKDFNMIVCVDSPSSYFGPSKTIDFNFFTVNNGVKQMYPPIVMTSTDNTLNYMNNQKYQFFTNYLYNCFKMPSNIEVKLNQNSYFGYSFLPNCQGTASFCNTTANAININFVNTMDANSFTTILPGSRLNLQTNTLYNDLFVQPYQSINSLYYSKNLTIEEVVQVSEVRLLDDTGNSFMRNAPIVKDTNINADMNTKRSSFKGGQANTPSYTFIVKPNEALTIYTQSQNKIDFIFGIIGGVFAFWYAIVHVLAVIYSKFIAYSYLAKLMYEQQGYDDCFFNKILAAFRIPQCLIPKCLGMRASVGRMKCLFDKMNSSLHQVSLLKYTDITYRLSCSFFNSIDAKCMSLFYFRQKINEADKIQKIVELQTKKIQEKDDDDFVDFNQQIQNANAKDNQVHNQDSQTQKNKVINQKQFNSPVQYEIENIDDNIIKHNQQKCSFLDLFQESPSFTFNKERTVSSACGGCMCVLMLLLILLVAYFEVGLYLTKAGRTVSYQTEIDDAIGAAGIDLITGSNFKLGLIFINSTTLVPLNISSYLGSIGISLLNQKFTHLNGIIVPQQTVFDLEPCSPSYLQSWMNPAVDPSYFINLNLAYCVPSGIALTLSGLPRDQVHKSFKLSIYNKLGNQTGVTILNTLLNSSLVKFYFSSPKQNSIDRSISYQINQIIFDFFGIKHNVVPTERNISLSKVKITYDDSISWQSYPETQLSHRLDPFVTTTQSYSYIGNPNTNAWYNISFANSKRKLIYNISTPKFYQTFGITGGIIVIFYFVFACLAKSFNRYWMRYLIGRELYVFDKLKVNEGVDKIKKIIRKTMTDRKHLQRMNNFSEWNIFQAYILSFMAGPINNYNFNNKLRRVTLIHERVAKDLDLIQFYMSLYNYRDIISKQIKKMEQGKYQNHIKITDIYLKHIFNPKPQQYTNNRLLSYAKLHKLSSYEQMVAYRASFNHFDIREIYDNNMLQRTFGLLDDDREVRLSAMRETIGSINTSSMGTSSIGDSIGESAVHTEGDD